MVSKGFPNVVTWGQQYNIGEKLTVILDCTLTLIAMQGHQNHKPRNRVNLGVQNILTKSSGLQ